MNLAEKEMTLELDLFSNGALTPENYKEKLTIAEEYLITLPQVEPDCGQLFLPGLYSRTITIPTGMILTGGVHKTDSIIVVSKGEIIVATENGNITIKAPAQFIGKKGTKRIAYCVDECVWTNIHQYDGPQMNVDDMKDHITCDNYADYEIYLAQQDYLLFLSEIGKTDLEVLELVVQTDDLVEFDESTPVSILPSKIACNGACLTKDVKAGEYIGKGSHGENRTLLTRFTNHSPSPNVSLSVVDNNLIFTASKDMPTFTELTVDYREVVRLRSLL